MLLLKLVTLHPSGYTNQRQTWRSESIQREKNTAVHRGMKQITWKEIMDMMKLMHKETKNIFHQKSTIKNFG